MGNRSAHSFFTLFFRCSQMRLPERRGCLRACQHAHRCGYASSDFSRTLFYFPQWATERFVYREEATAVVTIMAAQNDLARNGKEWKGEKQRQSTDDISRSNVQILCRRRMSLGHTAGGVSSDFRMYEKHENIARSLCCGVSCVVRRVEFDNWRKYARHGSGSDNDDDGATGPVNRQCSRTLTRTHSLQVVSSPNRGVWNASGNDTGITVEWNFTFVAEKKRKRNKAIDKIT